MDWILIFSRLQVYQSESYWSELSDMEPFEDLSNDNHDQIRKYLRFFRQKKDGIMREIDREFVDIKLDKIEETMFTKEDMLDYSDFVATAIKVCAS